MRGLLLLAAMMLMPEPAVSRRVSASQALGDSSGSLTSKWLGNLESEKASQCCTGNRAVGCDCSALTDDPKLMSAFCSEYEGLRKDGRGPPLTEDMLFQECWPHKGWLAEAHSASCQLAFGPLCIDCPAGELSKFCGGLFYGPGASTSEQPKRTIGSRQGDAPERRSGLSGEGAAHTEMHKDKEWTTSSTTSSTTPWTTSSTRATGTTTTTTNMWTHFVPGEPEAILECEGKFKASCANEIVTIRQLLPSCVSKNSASFYGGVLLSPVTCEEDEWGLWTVFSSPLTKSESPTCHEFIKSRKEDNPPCADRVLFTLYKGEANFVPGKPEASYSYECKGRLKVSCANGIMTYEKRLDRGCEMKDVQQAPPPHPGRQIIDVNCRQPAPEDGWVFWSEALGKGETCKESILHLENGYKEDPPSPPCEE